MSDQYLPTQVPRFELNINDDQLQNLLRDIQFNMSNQAADIERLKKELERKPSDFIVSHLPNPRSPKPILSWAEKSISTRCSAGCSGPRTRKRSKRSV